MLNAFYYGSHLTTYGSCLTAYAFYCFTPFIVFMPLQPIVLNAFYCFYASSTYCVERLLLWFTVVRVDHVLCRLLHYDLCLQLLADHSLCLQLPHYMSFMC